MGPASARLHPVLLVGGLWAVCTAANLGKAVHLDDTAYLEIAAAMARDPLGYATAAVNWDDTAEPLHRLNQPHLLFVPMAVVIRAFGPSELALHGLMAGGALLAIAVFFALARHVAPRDAALLTALFALGPALLPAQNLMVDVPLVGLWLLFFWGLLAGGRPPGSAWGVSAAAAAAACLVKYVSLVLLPTFAVLLALRRQLRASAWLALPAAALAVWSLHNWLSYGGVHLLDRPLVPTRASAVLARSVEWLVGLGAVAPFSVLWLPRLSARARAACLAPAAAAAFVVALASGGHPDATPQVRALWGLFLGNGVFLATATGRALLLEERRRGRSGPGGPVPALCLWLAGAFGFVVLFAEFMAVRHILLAVPAFLLVIGLADARPVPAWAARTALVSTAVLGIALAVSDWSYAAVHRDHAPRIARNLEGRTLWQLGHWGWQWYAGRAGMRTFDSIRAELSPGDTLVIAGSAHTQELRPEHRRVLSELARIEVDAGGASLLRTVSRRPAGGYHGFSFATRSLPWLFSRAPLEVYTVLRVADPAR